MMPEIARFLASHPEVEVELLPSSEPVNLTNRQADVAIGVVTIATRCHSDLTVTVCAAEVRPFRAETRSFAGQIGDF